MSQSNRPIEMKLEVVVVPVSDVERAKLFYASLGWRLDADFVVGDAFRAVQVTPPGSPCSVHFGKGLTAAAPGSASGLFLVVSDIVETHAALTARGVAVSDLFHRGVGEAPQPGVDPQRRSYCSYATFRDPDGNEWLLQEVTARLPGRVDSTDMTFTSAAGLARALRRAEAAHGAYEKRLGRRDDAWADWYADYLAGEQSGKALAS